MMSWISMRLVKKVVQKASFPFRNLDTFAKQASGNPSTLTSYSNQSYHSTLTVTMLVTGKVEIMKG